MERKQASLMNTFLPHAVCGIVHMKHMLFNDKHPIKKVTSISLQALATLKAPSRGDLQPTDV